jgi:hypothetical protein
LKSSGNGRREQVNINPSDAAALQVPVPNECDYLGVRNSILVVDLFVSGQEFSTASAMSDEKLSVDQVMAGHFLDIEQPLQFRYERRPIGE